MAWDKPGGNRPQGPNNDDGPPDLDEMFKRLKTMFSGDGKSNSDQGGSSGSGGSDAGLGPLLGLGALVLVGFAIYDSVYVVDQAERGVVTRFGAYNRTATGGLNFKLPTPLESVTKINVDQNNTISVRDQTILTSDENVVVVDLTVQYNIKNAENYLFKVRNPDGSLREIAESALREVIGQNNMDFVIIDGREAIASGTETLIQETLDLYQTGIAVTSVNLESAQPPEAVQDAFSDAIRAREDKERRINEAEAYANEIIPVARGEATQILEEAKAYRTRVVRGAEGETSRFAQIYEQYSAAPEVTRERIYIESIESVLGNTNKVLMDAEGNAPLSYLPLDQLMRNRSERAVVSESTAPIPQSVLNSVPRVDSSVVNSTSTDDRSRSRSRGE
ncbi:MAG: FtsH protease activity modulator HflK [Gammaproteobacteria bacterium]|nr:FtsH protease activity modulator HflK [Gammaproteobacteria bacterium]